MAHPLKHAESSARQFGGKAEDYLPIHNWFDESKAFFPDFRHRALRHHAEGIFLAEKLFGAAMPNFFNFRAIFIAWMFTCEVCNMSAHRRDIASQR